MFYPKSEAMDADPKTEQDGEGDTGPRSGSQSTEPIMSVKQGKMKAIAVEEEAALPGLGEELEVEPASNSGRFNIKIGGGFNEVSTKASREDEELTKAQEPLISAMQDQTNLEAFKKTNQLNNLDAMWAALKKGAHDDRQNSIKLDTVKYKLANDIIPLATREEDLVRRKAGDSITSEKSQVALAAKLAASERKFATDRHHLIQGFANAAADARKENYGEVLTTSVRTLRDQGASKYQIENYLMDQLLYEGRDKSLGVTNSLEDEGIQAVVNLVDNIELQKDFADQDKSNPKKPAGLEDLARTLDLDCQKHIADLVSIAFKYNSNIQVRRVSNVTNPQDEVFQEAMSVNQQHILMKVMEAINQYSFVAADLLHRTFWVPEAAIALWYEGKPPDVIIPADVGSGEDSPESIYKSPAKRSYVAEAGPSSSTKKLRTGSPEEDTEAARARFERAIMAKTDVTEEDSAADVPQQKSDEIVVGGLRLPHVPRNYSLEELNSKTAEDAKAQTGVSRERTIIVSNEKTESSDPNATEPSATSPFNDKTSNSKAFRENVGHHATTRGTSTLPDGTSFKKIHPIVSGKNARLSEALMLANNLPNPPVSNTSPAPAPPSRNNDQLPQNGSNIEGPRAGTEATSGIA
ncbi:hypothetical protein EJ07DRAFT_155188 [Lizonia empirigonia]|nr:hypothetical protein EJ07DRAFT_155188 [Lizonia empirigonia]